MKKRIETKCTHVTPVGGNVFLDLGFPLEEAAALKAESDKLIKSQQVTALKGLIKKPSVPVTVEAMNVTAQTKDLEP